MKPRKLTAAAESTFAVILKQQILTRVPMLGNGIIMVESTLGCHHIKSRIAGVLLLLCLSLGCWELQAMADLSEQQIADLLYLRRMCITRRAQLANCRRAKLNQIPAECFSDIRMPHPVENVVKLQNLGAFVRKNGSEDFRVWSATMCACLRGVSHSSIVNSYKSIVSPVCAGYLSFRYWPSIYLPKQGKFAKPCDGPAKVCSLS